MVLASEKKKQPPREPDNAKPDSNSPPADTDAETVRSELTEDLEKERAKSADFLRRLQYLQADFENYRKRVEKEMSESRQYGNQRLLSDLIVVNDELELALKQAEDSNENPMIVQGVEMVHKRLQGLLSKEGVEKIPGKGSRFNPDLHEAALAEASDQEEGTILEEIRQGYTLKGKVLRPSIVKVAASPSEPESKSEKGHLEESENP